jgi:hypothetical protein
VGGAEPRGGPVRDLVADVVGLAARQLGEFPVGVAAHPGDPFAEAKEAVEDLVRLRPGGDVARQHDAAGCLDRRLGEHGLKRGQHSVNVGQDRD